jgi:hypothetical protein
MKSEYAYRESLQTNAGIIRWKGHNFVISKFIYSSPDSLLPPLNSLPPKIAVICFLHIQGKKDGERKKRKNRVKNLSSVTVLSTGSLICPPSAHQHLKTSLSPEHFSLPLVTSRLVAPYWLASRSSVHPVNASSPSRWLMRELSETYGNPSHSHYPSRSQLQASPKRLTLPSPERRTHRVRSSHESLRTEIHLTCISCPC